MKFLFTSECVSGGHPDKLCDYVSDSVLDACLAIDPDAKVACETATKGNMVMILGEITCKGEVNFEQIVRKACKEIGYTDWDIGLDYKTCQVIISIDKQSSEIAQSVHVEKDIDSIGAGDQGLMIGYATNETPELMPLSYVLSCRLLEKMDELRKNKDLPWLRPDCKSQVTVQYEKLPNGSLKALNVHTVLISAQHSPDITVNEIREQLKEKVCSVVIPEKYLTEETKYVINPSESFVIGGPRADAGLTGRKIIADTYGGWGGHGGGAFSGKDPTKVDRSAAYAARWIAKSLVHNELCERCLVQVAYGIGLADPISVCVDTYGTHSEGYTDDDISQIAHDNFNLKPGRIIENFNLKRPIFTKTTLYGHFLTTDKDHKWEIPKDLSSVLNKE